MILTEGEISPAARAFSRAVREQSMEGGGLSMNSESIFNDLLSRVTSHVASLLLTNVPVDATPDT